MKANPKSLSPGKVSLLTSAKLHWQPVKLSVPRLDPEVTQLDPIQRTGEVLRYSVLGLEYWLSPGGSLRQWIRLNVCIAVVLTVPALLIVPVVTYVLGAFATWAELLVRIAKHLLVFPLAAIALVALVSALLFLVRSLLLPLRR
jgi:hypothetical protein